MTTEATRAVGAPLDAPVRRLAGCVLVCATFALTACAGEIAGWKVTAAQEVCAARGGIDRLTNTFGSGVVCRDGYWQEIKGKP